MLKRTGIFGLQLGLSLALITGFAASVVAQITVAQITPSRRTNTNTTVTQEGDRFDIGGGQLSRDEANLFHQFEQFGLSQDQIARFLSNPEIRNILTTVDGGDASIINGLLQVSGSNANLYLLNPAGILFGPNARLDVAGSFYANTANGLTFGDRTLDIFGNPDFADLVGDPTGFSFSGLNPGVIVNAGNLAVPTGETLSLMGGTVINTGTLSAPEGTITIAAIPGETHVRLSQDGALLSLDVLPDGLAALPTNPASLPELLTGGSVPDVGLVIEPDGTVRLVAETPVTIPDAPGVAIASGTLNVAGSMGGAIDVVGDRVGLIAASLMADGTNGGGHIRIGGDYQGGGTLPTASLTYVSADSSLSANADTTGDGGRIIIWADGSTAYSGTLSATGGTLSGNGGFAEVSGRQNLGYDGTANLSAPNGTPGTLLLDPENIIIGAVGTNDGELGDSEILTGDRPGETLFISDAALEGIVGAITLQASNNIIINSLVDTLTFNGAIEFIAINGIFDSTAQEIATIGGNLSITAGEIRTGALNTALFSDDQNTSIPPGNIRLESTSGDIRTEEITSFFLGLGRQNGGTIDLISAGNLEIERGIRAWSASGNGADINLSAEGDIYFRNPFDPNVFIQSFAGGGENPIYLSIPGNSGNVTISSNGSIIAPRATINSAATRPGNAGDISITAHGDISINGLWARAESGNVGDNAGDAGNILVRSRNGGINLNGNFIDAHVSQPSQGRGGDITLDAFDDIVLGINPFLNPDGTFGLGSVDTSGYAGGGNIQITSRSGTINASQGNIISLSRNGDAGSITLDASESIIPSTSGLLRNFDVDGNPLEPIEVGWVDTSGRIGGDISLAGEILLREDTFFNLGSISNSSSGNLSIAGSINGNQSLEIVAKNILFSNALGNDIPLEDLLLSTTGALTFSDDVTLLGNLVLGEASVLRLGGNLRLDGDVVIIPPVDLISAASITSSGRLSLENRISSPGAASNLALVANGGLLSVQGINTNGGNLLLTGREGIAINGVLDTTGQGTGGDLTVASAILGGQDLTVQSGAGNVFFADTVGSDTPLQDLTVDTTGIVTFGDDVTLRGVLDLGTASTLRLGGDLQTLTGNLVLQTPITVIDDASITAAGNLRLTEDVQSAGGANALALTAGGSSLTTQNINTNGGDLTLRSPQFLTAGNLTTSNAAGGGNLTVIAGTRITTGDIDTSALTGDGGDVFIDPTDDIQTGFINSQSRDAAGGDVTAITGSLFRSTNTFVAADGTRSSISAIGGTQGGNITLSHFGGAERVPFLVGSAAANGTAGAIATGTPGNVNAIFPNRVFPGSYDQFGNTGDIRLITQDFPVPDPDLERTSGWEIREEIDRFDIDQWIFGLEYYFTRMSERYLGNEDTAIRTVDEVRAILQAIERQTGERPAIIYAFFYPEIATRSENEVPLEITWLGGTADDTNTDERSQDSLHLVLVTADDDPILVRVPNATRDEVPDVIDTFRRRINRGAADGRDRTYMPLARQAYSLLLEPLETLLQERGITNLVYVMEPGLRSTPLAAMMDANGFIIERYSLGQMPSVSLTDTTYTGIGGTEVLAGGISDFSGFSTLNPLPGAAMEAQTIGQQLWPDALLINERVTRAELMQIYNNEPHGIVHLATHADFVEGDISESYIQLHGERLHLDEIREMGWGNDPTVRLLVLSACNTATGSVEVELGFGGIATQAGVQSVLASLWKVNDAGTLALMAAFYEQLGRPEVTIKAEALRQAQRMMVGENIGFQGGYLTGTEATIILSDEMAELDNLYPTHPYYWSGFTMLGSPW